MSFFQVTMERFSLAKDALHFGQDGMMLISPVRCDTVTCQKNVPHAARMKEYKYECSSGIEDGVLIAKRIH
jgi:hypothetical protein